MPLLFFPFLCILPIAIWGCRCYTIDTPRGKELMIMTTKEYIVDNCHAAFKAFEEIANRIPCFVEYDDRTQPLPYVSVCITCRNEDLAFVERMIAEFV